MHCAVHPREQQDSIQRPSTIMRHNNSTVSSKAAVKDLSDRRVLTFLCSTQHMRRHKCHQLLEKALRKTKVVSVSIIL